MTAKIKLKNPHLLINGKRVEIFPNDDFEYKNYHNLIDISQNINNDNFKYIFQIIHLFESDEILIEANNCMQIFLDIKDFKKMVEGCLGYLNNLNKLGGKDERIKRKT